MSSSRFVSGGTDEAPIERDAEWRAAQAEIAARHAARADAAKQQATGKSLFETLQANKAAKQEAFEESIKLRNQFRTLDEDEVEFLDTVLESTRRREASVRRETAEQVEAFRRQREAAEKDAVAAATEAPDSAAETVSWSTAPGRKRKLGADKGLLPVKIRRTSSTVVDADENNTSRKAEAVAKSAESKDKTKSATDPSVSKPPALPPGQSPTSTKTPAKDNTSTKKETPLLGLAAYADDDDDDDDW